MSTYYVNRNTQRNGDHEVHKSGCAFQPPPENALYLGEFDSCDDAVREARRFFPQSNNCRYCSSERRAG